ncbi:MAG: hypothetical protein PVF91_01060 [Chromatiales bacterium]|jgi:hypothetical protein
MYSNRSFPSLTRLCIAVLCLLATAVTAAEAGTPDLASVVAAAEAYTGEPARSAALEDRDGFLFFRVNTSGAAGKLTVKVDSHSGRILAVDPDEMLPWIRNEHPQSEAAPGDGRGALSDAIRTAERITGGTALSGTHVGLVGARGVYRIDVLKSGRVEIVTLDRRGEPFLSVTPAVTDESP